MPLVEFLFPSLITVAIVFAQRAEWSTLRWHVLSESIAAHVSSSLSSLFPGVSDAFPAICFVTECFLRFLSLGVLLTPFFCLFLSKRRKGRGDQTKEDVQEDLSTRFSIDSILRSVQFEEREVLQYDVEWLSGEWLYFLCKVAGYVIDGQTTTSAPIAIMEEATPYAYSLFLGLSERGRSVLLISPSLNPGFIASILHEHHCEIILLNQSLLGVLENVLEMDHAVSLRAILCTENHYFNPSDLGNSLRAEEALEEEYDLPVRSLDYLMERFCMEKALAVETRAPSLETAGLEVAETPERDARTMILFREEGEGRVVSQDELMEAVGRVMRTIPIETRDVVLMQGNLSVYAFAVFAACLQRRCRLSVMTSGEFGEECRRVSPTVLAVSAETYGTLCERAHHRSGLCRVVKQICKEALFGSRLRRCLVFSDADVRAVDVHFFDQ